MASVSPLSSASSPLLPIHVALRHGVLLGAAPAVVDNVGVAAVVLDVVAAPAVSPRAVVHDAVLAVFL